MMVVQVELQVAIVLSRPVQKFALPVDLKKRDGKN